MPLTLRPLDLPADFLGFEVASAPPSTGTTPPDVAAMQALRRRAQVAAPAAGLRQHAPLPARSNETDPFVGLPSELIGEIFRQATPESRSRLSRTSVHLHNEAEVIHHSVLAQLRAATRDVTAGDEPTAQRAQAVMLQGLAFAERFGDPRHPVRAEASRAFRRWVLRRVRRGHLAGLADAVTCCRAHPALTAEAHGLLILALPSRVLSLASERIAQRSLFMAVRDLVAQGPAHRVPSHVNELLMKLRHNVPPSHQVDEAVKTFRLLARTPPSTTACWKYPLVATDEACARLDFFAGAQNAVPHDILDAVSPSLFRLLAHKDAEWIRAYMPRLAEQMIARRPAQFS